MVLQSELHNFARIHVVRENQKALATTWHHLAILRKSYGLSLNSGSAYSMSMKCAVLNYEMCPAHLRFNGRYCMHVMPNRLSVHAESARTSISSICQLGLLSLLRQPQALSCEHIRTT